MECLSNKLILNLARKAVQPFGFNKEERKELEHLKTCEDCYRKFRIYMEYADLFENACEEYADLFPAADEDIDWGIIGTIVSVETEAGTDEGILSKLRIAGRRVTETLQGAALQFIPSAFPAFEAGRGAGDADQEHAPVRMEAKPNSDTYLVYDPEEGSLFIQVNTNDYNVDGVRIFLEFDDFTNVEMKMEREGSLMRGIASDLPDVDFNVCIKSAA